jgi:hypothetical protein
MRRVRGSVLQSALRPLGLASAVAVVAACYAFAAPAAAAPLTITLAGSGTGTVTSSPPGINCSNTPGDEQTACSFDLNEFQGVDPVLTAVPDSSFILSGWSGNSGGTCGSGRTNPCAFSPPFSGEVAVDVTATFGIAPDPLIATTVGASDVTHQAAFLNGRVDPEGSPVEACRFEWGTTTEYGATVPCSPDSLGSGTANVPVSAEVSYLVPGSTYHFRVVASNAAGEQVGADRTFTAGSAPAEDCPNASIRAFQGVTALPACMALELASPPRKANQQMGVESISVDDSRVILGSKAPLGDTTGLGQGLGDQYVATRGATGWRTRGVAPPGDANTSLGFPMTYTPDFSRWLTLAASEFEVGQGVMRAVEGDLDGGWVPRSNLLVPAGAHGASNATTVVFRGASADFSHFLFSPGDVPPNAPTATYLPGDPAMAGTGYETNVYVVHRNPDGSPTLALLSRDSDGKVWGGRCGAHLGGSRPIGSNVNALGGLNQGAISSDGARMYISARAAQPVAADCSTVNRTRILTRVETPDGVKIDELIVSECERVSPACDMADGDDVFQGASVDGTKVFFTTPRQLADSDLDSGSACSSSAPASGGCDLYLYDADQPAGSRLTQVSAGDASDPTPGADARVLGTVTAVSGDGSHVYFAAAGVLTATPNSHGATAVDGEPNLYVYYRDAAHPAGRIAFVGTLAANDVNGPNGTDVAKLVGVYQSYVGPATAVPMLDGDPSDGESGGDGHALVFRSFAPLTPDDGDSERLDVYRYDADTGSLQRISKAVSGSSDDGPFNAYTASATHLLSGPDYATVHRSVSEDGGTIVFATAEKLAPGLSAMYLWRRGQLINLPGETFSSGAEGGKVPVTSLTGDTVLFSSVSRLLATDGDDTSDAYVARVGGGFADAAAPDHCAVLANGCQGPGADALSAEPRVAPGAPDVARELRRQLAVRVPSFKARRVASRSGWLAVAVRSNRPGRISATATARVEKRTRVVARGAVRARTAGLHMLRLRLSAAARHSLNTGKALRLTVGVAASGARTRAVAIRLPGVQS